MATLFITANEPTATQRTVHFMLRLASDGISAATGITGQPQISTDGAAFTNAGIGALTEVGSGEYTAVLTQAAVLTAGQIIRPRFRDAGNTVVEARAEEVIVVAFDPYDIAGLGLSRLDAAVSTRSIPGDAMALTSGERTTMTNKVWDEPNASHVTAGTTGKNLSTAGTAADPWSTALPGAYAGGTAGNIVGNNLNAAITTRSVAGDAMSLTPTERTTIDPLAKAIPGAYAGGTAGFIIGNNLNASISTRALEAGGNVAAIKAKTDLLPALPAASGDLMNLTSGARSNIVNDNWNELVANHLGVGTMGAKLNTAASAGDPLASPVPGAYAAGTAGNLLGNRLDVAISTRAPEAGGNVANIKAKTDNLPASPAAVGSAMTLTSAERDAIANALLDLSNAIETGITTRATLRIALAGLAGKISGAAGPSVTFRNVTDTKTRITAAVDSVGDRNSVTVDGS